MKIFSKIAERYPGQRINIMGHTSPDTDTVLATELFCRFCRRIGIDALPVLTGVVGKDEDAVCRIHGIRIDEWKTQTNSDEVLFLVDCHTTSYPGRVIGCIDHHPTREPVPESMADLYINDRFSSSALAVLRQAVCEGITVTDDDEIIALRSVFMDTQSLISPKFVREDMIWIDRMIGKHGLDKEELIRQGLCFSDLTLPPEELAFGGTKYHNIKGHRCASSHIQAENIPRELAERCAALADERRRAEGLEIWLLCIAEPLRPSSVIYELTDSGVSVTEYDRMLSRSVDIIPWLEEKFIEIKSKKHTSC